MTTEGEWALFIECRMVELAPQITENITVLKQRCMKLSDLFTRLAGAFTSARTGFVSRSFNMEMVRLFISVTATVARIEVCRCLLLCVLKHRSYIMVKFAFTLIEKFMVRLMSGVAVRTLLSVVPFVNRFIIKAPISEHVLRKKDEKNMGMYSSRSRSLTSFLAILRELD